MERNQHLNPLVRYRLTKVKDSLLYSPSIFQFFFTLMDTLLSIPFSDENFCRHMRL